MYPVLIKKPMRECDLCGRDMFEGEEILYLEVGWKGISVECCEDCAEEWWREYKKENKKELER